MVSLGASAAAGKNVVLRQNCDDDPVMTEYQNATACAPSSAYQEIYGRNSLASRR
jgi:hypothetical protein